MDVEPMATPTVHEHSPYLVKDNALKEDQKDGRKEEEKPAAEKEETTE